MTETPDSNHGLEISESDFASLCLLSYNRPEFLRTAITTIHQHADAPFELIVHDDGSSDPAVQSILLDELHHGRVSTLILNPPGHNQGQGTALNRMFHMAAGDPIIKLDQDLIFKPGWLREVNRIIHMNAVRLRARRHAGGVEPRIGLLGLMHYEHDPVASPKCKMADHGPWEEHTHILGSAFAVTRECWAALGPFNEHSEAFAEDWEFQRWVTQSHDFACGLPPYGTDFVHNQGFGVGPSTVVVDYGKVATIHKTPAVYSR